MSAYNSYLNELVNKNKNTFSDFNGIKWLNPYHNRKLLEKRKDLLAEVGEYMLFKDTKPYHKGISEGCMLCGSGRWSCLFITGKCNASCFYCPAPQLTDEIPVSQNITFETPEAYAEYVDYFQFKGVSFSGGEPLLFFDRTLNYLKQIRKVCDPGIYIWMYTNGILADEEKFRRLAEAGLNEVRFDIGATGFRTDRIKDAIGIIPQITIEIPAIPEQKDKLKQLLPEIIQSGVTNINLHQLRLTRYNAPKLLKRNYSFIHAEQPIVAESEIAALEILSYVKNNNFDIGVNYCSFHFKNRFQKAGFRRQVAGVLADPDDIITEKGFIRKFDKNKIGYKTCIISDLNSNPGTARKLELKHKTYAYTEGFAMKEIILNANQKMATGKIMAIEPDEIPDTQPLFNIWQFEYIEKGLREW